MGKSPKILKGSETDLGVISRLNRDLAGGKLFVCKAIKYREDGSTFMIKWKIEPMRDERYAAGNLSANSISIV